MKKSILAIAVASTIGLCGSALAAEIFSPGADEVVYQSTLNISAQDTDAAVNTARWAVRLGTCAASTGTVAGNVDGKTDVASWSFGAFNASLDISLWQSGLYCFVLNTEEGSASGSRLTQYFYIVDEYAKVGGTIYLPDANGELPPGNSPTDVVEGVVGKIGTMVVGSIMVNYRQLGEYRTYIARAMTFRAATGIGVSDPTAVADIETEDGALIFVLDSSASPTFPRGALVLREDYAPSYSEYEIDGSPGMTGADSWVPMEKGNNHVGTR